MSPDSAEVLENDSIKFYTKVFGKPIPKVTWFKDSEKQLGDEDTKIQTKEVARKLEVESWLKIDKSTLSDESLNYMIEAENSAGRTSAVFDLKG